jgi:hypothetical protein
MTLMLAKTYAAFKAAGVTEDQAQAAAEELASVRTRSKYSLRNFPYCLPGESREPRLS